MQNVQTLDLPSVTTSFETISPIIPAPAVVARAEDALPPVLVADDDEDDTYFIERLIKKTGIKNRVVKFDDGSEVVNYLGRARMSAAGRKHPAPLLLFLDLNMRGLGGFGFLEWARNKKELAPLTIVVLTNSSNPADMERALELGAHRYLVKYPSQNTFTTIVRSVYPQTVF
jgi:CheY-like chemotaxis protein